MTGYLWDKHRHPGGPNWGNRRGQCPRARRPRTMESSPHRRRSKYRTSWGSSPVLCGISISSYHEIYDCISITLYIIVPLICLVNPSWTTQTCISTNMFDNVWYTYTYQHLSFKPFLHTLNISGDSPMHHQSPFHVGGCFKALPVRFSSHRRKSSWICSASNGLTSKQPAQPSAKPRNCHFSAGFPLDIVENAVLLFTAAPRFTQVSTHSSERSSTTFPAIRCRMARSCKVFLARRKENGQRNAANDGTTLP